MSVMKKYLLLCLSVLTVFSMTACSSSKETGEKAQPEAETQTISEAEEAAGSEETEETEEEESVEEEPAEAETRRGPENAADGWTIFVYMCGSDLESQWGCASNDISEMLDSTYSDDVRVVVQTGGATSWELNVDPEAIERYVRMEDGMSLADTQPAADMGDAETLESFLDWGVTNYPAEHMGLILWNHGGGSISGVCFDEINDYDSLALSDIRSVLEDTADEAGKFEFIGFDACLMSTLETANMLTPYANYMYASEEVEPGTGWDYTPILSYLAENPEADGRELGAVQCDAYYDSTQVDEEDPSVTFSVTDLSKINDLVTSFDETSKELSEYAEYAPIARGIYNADNFGGNNKTEGYTNMVDLADILRNVSEYAPSAGKTLEALENAVVCTRNGSMHDTAGGISVYYPLCVQGSQEISIFRDICPSTWYYSMVAGVAANADLTASTEGIGLGDVEDSSTLEVQDAYLDDGGNYTVELANMDEFAYASCSVYMDDGNDGFVYIGEDDDVIVDYDAYTIQDDFDGTWLWLDGIHLLPIELVSRDEDMSLYVCSVLLNGEETNLQIAYDWNEGTFSILGTWDGIDSETGLASRSAEPLKDGDVLNIVYWCLDADGEWSTFTGQDIEVEGEMEVYYDTLTEGDYYYAINLYDIYGNGYQLDYTVFYVNDDGSVSFYE